MKVKIKTYNGELPSYLTVGKVYEVVAPTSNNGVRIITDDGAFLSTEINNSPTLNGGSWEIIE
jgi:zona occludens toxin (predicted ATPase)